MTGFNYARMAARAAKLIERFGERVKLTRTSAAGATTTIYAQGVKASTITHTLGDSGISIGDDKILLEAGAQPQPGDRIEYGDESRVIVDPVIVLSPAGVRVLVECYARIG